MKTSLTTYRQLYALLLILSSHSLFPMFAQEDLPRDSNIHRQEKTSDFRKFSLLESDQENTQDKPAFRLKFTRYKKPRILSQPSETEPIKPVMLISRQERDNRAIQSAAIEIALGAGALGCGTGAATGVGAGIGAILTGPALPAIGAGLLAVLIINEIFNNNTKDNSGGGGGGGKDPDKDKKEALERQRLEQVRQAQVIEAEKIRVATEAQERQRIEQIRQAQIQAQIIEEQRVQKIKDEQERQRLEQVRHVQTIEETLIFQPIDLDAKLHTCIQTLITDHSEPSPYILINEIYNHTEKNEAVAHAIFIPGVGICIGSGAPVAAGGIGGLLAGPAIPVIVVGGVGIKWVISVIKGKIEAKAKKDSSGGGGGDNSDPEKDPKKDKDKEKNQHKGKLENQNGTYENNPKHHQNSKGNIGKAPRDGQKALNESIAVPGKDFRMAIQDGKIVQLNQHSPGKYHGYIVENFHKLDPKAQKALSKAGLVNAKSGKIVK